MTQRDPGDGARYHQAPCGLATIRHDGEIVEANASFREMVGDDTLAADPIFHDLLRIGDRIYWETHLGPLLEMQGFVREIAVEITTDDGRLPVLLNARTEHPGDPDSTIDLAIFPAQDRRSYEAELLAARKRAEESEARARLLAATLQQSLLPPSVPDVSGTELGAAYRPASDDVDVGGDFYDFFRVGPADWLIAVGDVVGKGARAAAATALVRYVIRGAAMETTNLAEVLGDVNAALLLERGNEMCTVLLARISDTGGGQHVTLTLAGHPVPRVVTADGDVSTVGSHGDLLGAFEDVSFRIEEVALGGGDTLVCFTDGVPEARQGAEFFGDRRLDELLARHRELPAGDLAATLADSAVAFQADKARDDVAVVVIR